MKNVIKWCDNVSLGLKYDENEALIKTYKVMRFGHHKKRSTSEQHWYQDVIVLHIGKFPNTLFWSLELIRKTLTIYREKITCFEAGEVVFCLIYLNSK